MAKRVNGSSPGAWIHVLVKSNNTNQVLLKPKFFAINALEATHESPINDEIILKEVKAALLSDKVTKDYKSLLKSGPREFEKSLQDWNYENGLLLYRGKIYIPHSVDGDQREFDLETRVTTNGNNKTPRCFTVVH